MQALVAYVRKRDKRVQAYKVCIVLFDFAIIVVTIVFYYRQTLLRWHNVEILLDHRAGKAEAKPDSG